MAAATGTSTVSLNIFQAKEAIINDFSGQFFFCSTSTAHSTDPTISQIFTHFYEISTPSLSISIGLNGLPGRLSDAQSVHSWRMVGYTAHTHTHTQNQKQNSNNINSQQNKNKSAFSSVYTIYVYKQHTHEHWALGTLGTQQHTTTTTTEPIPFFSHCPTLSLSGSFNGIYRVHTQHTQRNGVILVFVLIY